MLLLGDIISVVNKSKCIFLHVKNFLVTSKSFSEACLFFC